MRTITFNELRKIKDSLPSGSMHRIADELGLHVDTVRNFFGGHNFKEGKSVGIHLEPGPDGGAVFPGHFLADGSSARSAGAAEIAQLERAAGQSFAGDGVIFLDDDRI